MTLKRLFLGAAAAMLLCAMTCAGAATSPITGVSRTPRDDAPIAYELIDTVEMQTPQRTVRVATRAMLVIVPLFDGFSVEIQRGATEEAPAGPDGPGMGSSVVYDSSGAALYTANVTQARFECRRDPQSGLPSMITGLPGALQGELVGMLGRTTPGLVLQPGAEVSLVVPIGTSGGAYALRATQQNATAEFDLRLSGAGQAGLATRGWVLPIAFKVPTQEVSKRTSVMGEMLVRYNPQSGATDGSVVLKTEIVTSSNPVVKLVRTTELRPSEAPVRLDETVAAPALAGSGRLAGRAGDWSRTLTLAILGTRHAKGFHELAASVWFAQCVVDQQFGKAFKAQALTDVAPLSKALSAGVPAVDMARSPTLGETRPKSWEIALISGGSDRMIDAWQSDESQPPYGEVHEWEMGSGGPGGILAFVHPSRRWGLRITYRRGDSHWQADEAASYYSAVPTLFDEIYNGYGFHMAYSSGGIRLHREWGVAIGSRMGVSYEFVLSGEGGTIWVPSAANEYEIEFEDVRHTYEMYWRIPLKHWDLVAGVRFAQQTGNIQVWNPFGAEEDRMKYESLDGVGARVGFYTAPQHWVVAGIWGEIAIENGVEGGLQLGVRF